MPERSNRRLLSLDRPTGALTHGTFTGILDKLNPDDLLIFNNTRVISAHLFGRKTSGGKIEVLVERVLDDKCILAHTCVSEAPKPGVEPLLGDDESVEATTLARHGALFRAEFSDEHPVLGILNGIDCMPLPSYVDHSDEGADRELYQTACGTRSGTATVPTAGLHFDEPLLDKLRTKDVETALVTLYVGARTFQPVHVDSIEEHTMHSEYTKVPQEAVGAVPVTKARSNYVTAVGTTSIRSLESVAQTAKGALVAPFSDDTQIFIYSGYQHQVTDALITNFHFPESTLIVLVSAFVSYQHIMNTYKMTVGQKYRFLSYGDAMSVTYNPQAVSGRL